jgi:phosphoglycolate/pyridoxal phosphate phosphatase family enzyme
LSQNPLAPGKKVYVIGERGIIDELQLANISHIGGPADNSKTLQNPLRNLEVDNDVGAVLVGFDSEINYYKIQYAQLCLNTIPNCRFIATNEDQVKHLTSDQLWAGSGAMVGAITGCTGQYPIVVGKPSSYLIDYILGLNSVERCRMCMVGDRLDTDILFGLNNGLQTLLVFSGVTSRDQLMNDNNKIFPHYVANGIGDLFPTN